MSEKETHYAAIGEVGQTVKYLAERANGLSFESERVSLK